jgi:hypothetical protein
MAITISELSQLIVKRICTRAMEEPDPVDYFSRATARALMLQERAKISGDLEGELLEFGREFGLLVQGVERQIL